MLLKGSPGRTRVPSFVIEFTDGTVGRMDHSLGLEDITLIKDSVPDYVFLDYTVHDKVNGYPFDSVSR